jgi:AcrR family transcriptional regulator
MPKKSDRPSRIIEAALKLAAERGWHAVSLAEIAGEAGLTVLQLYAVFRSKTAILEAFHQRVDEAVLGGAASSEDERPRDRLFDTIMRRFDALGPHKAAVQALVRDAWADPLATLFGVPSLKRSIAWMLESSGVSASGWQGRGRVNLLLGIYLSVLKVWLADESPDMMKTMAALDRRLRQAERWLGLASRGGAEDSPVAAAG